MKKPFFICILSVLIISTYAQESFRISRPDLQFINEILTIRYDISGCVTGETIDIKLVVLNSKGDTLRPGSVSGDLGNLISCGPGKTILWNIAEDKINIDDELEVMVTGNRSPAPPAPAYSDLQKSASRGNVIISSVLIPGLGQKKASGKAGYLVFSGLICGTAASSFYYSMKSKQYKDDYLAAAGTERDDLFNKWEQSYNLARYLAIGAAGIWAVNIAWAAAIPIKNDHSRKVKLSFMKVSNKELLISARLQF